MASLPPPIQRALGVTRLRLRLQQAFETVAAGAVMAAATVAVGLYLWRLDVLTRRGLVFLCAAAGVLLLAAVAVGLAKKVAWSSVAARLDAAHRLHDRVGSALAFAAEPAPTPFMQAAIADAAAHGGELDARRAAPFAWPRALPMAGLLSGLAVLVALLRFPALDTVAPVAVPPTLPHLTLSSELLDAEKEAAAEMVKQASENGDPEALKAAKELQALLQQLDAGELTRKDVFEQLADIEKRLQTRDQELADIQEKLKKAGREMGANKALAKVKEALAKEDLEKAHKELEALAKEAQKLADEREKTGKPETASDEKKRQDLSEALARAAAAVQTKDESPERKLERQEQQKRDQEEDKLKDEQRKLQKKLEKNPKDEEARRQLQRNQRQLERLEREKKEQSEARRELERLEKEMQKAAEELRKQLSPEALKQLQKMAEEAGKMQQEIKKLGSGKQMKMQIAELKEVLRRAGQNQGPGKGQQAQNGQPTDGDGNEKGKGRGKQLQDFNQRAGGSESTLILGGKGQGGDTVLLPIPMPGQGGGDKPGDQPGGGDKPGGDKPGQGGDQAGTEHDPNMMGRQTSLASRKVDTKVAGKEGAGPSKSETIAGSAGKGFATQSYKKVYGEYSSVVEEVMTKERVPPGYRFYIKRYFKLIKPRE